jgi:hypothetical protein
MVGSIAVVGEDSAAVVGAGGSGVGSGWSGASSHAASKAARISNRANLFINNPLSGDAKSSHDRISAASSPYCIPLDGPFYGNIYQGITLCRAI